MAHGVDKKIIADRFCSAIRSYEHEAVIQRQIAQKLFDMICRNVDAKETLSIAEVGCGTGFLSKLIYENLVLKNTHNSLWLNDLCIPMGNLFKEWERTCFIGGDAEMIFGTNGRTMQNKTFQNLESKGFDLIATTSVIQWFENQIVFLRSCNKHLADNGLMALSTFGPETFKEIRSLTGVGLEYFSLDEYKRFLQPYFEIVEAEEEQRTQLFSSPIAVLKHLKSTGVNGVRSLDGTKVKEEDGYEEFRWTKQRLEKFSDDYTRLYSSDDKKSVRLTYHPIYLILKKI